MAASAIVAIRNRWLDARALADNGQGSNLRPKAKHAPAKNADETYSGFAGAFAIRPISEGKTQSGKGTNSTPPPRPTDFLSEE